MTKNAEEKIVQLIELMHVPFTDNGPEETLIRCEIWGAKKCVSILLSHLLASLNNPPLAEFILRMFKEKCKEPYHGLEEHLDCFIKVLDYDDVIKSAAISLLVEIGDDRAVAPLQKLTTECTPEISTEAAIGILLRLKPDELENMFPILSDAIHSENLYTQFLVLHFIELFSDRAKEFIPRIRELLKNPDQEWEASLALYKVTDDDTEALQLLHNLRITEENDFVAQAIADELEKQIKEVALSKKPSK